MIHLITVTEAARSFSDIIGRVYYKGDEFEIKKGSTVVARLIPSSQKTAFPIKKLNKFFKEGPHLSEDDIEDFQKDIEEIRSLAGDTPFKWDE